MAARHLFVCTNSRSSGKPACGPRGGDALVAAVQLALLERGGGDALVTNCACLGPCFDGPNAVVYPDGVWYAGLEPDDAAALADHLAAGRVLAEKVSHRPGAELASEPSPAGRPGDRDHAERSAEGSDDRGAGRR
ncbi:MAG TPA: (2Fe-2S) ferredoxin domain-containing protein [Kofleriaceae bacterium]|nr:(2Fe-2S) ferredoxin domain-containing protein [Kofleriaceae bacterium]